MKCSKGTVTIGNEPIPDNPKRENNRLPTLNVDTYEETNEPHPQKSKRKLKIIPTFNFDTYKEANKSENHLKPNSIDSFGDNMEKQEYITVQKDVDTISYDFGSYEEISQQYRLTAAKDDDTISYDFGTFGRNMGHS